MLSFIAPESIAYTILVLAAIIASGHALGGLKWGNFHLGVAGVLFSGLLLGHFKIHVNESILEFAREFGLILFVYTIGMQVGPGFFASFKKDGLQLNGLALAAVLIGSLSVVLLSLCFQIPVPVMLGILSGATTNTPSLAAAQQALQELPGTAAEMLKMPSLGYAVCYPFGIIGTILSMVIVRLVLRLNPKNEAENYAKLHAKSRRLLETRDILVKNTNFHGMTLDQIPLPEKCAVISRIMHQGQVQIASPDSVVETGDILRAVGTLEKLEELRLVLGSWAQIDWESENEEIVSKWIIVTRKDILGKTIEELEPFIYGVTITRVSRGDIEFSASSDLELNFADRLMAVGEEHAIKRFASIVGNSSKELNAPELVPVFVGIAIGVILGSIPFQVPGMPAPLKLGLAGGPLIVAMLLSRLGRIGRVVWYLPMPANYMVREIGISLFLASVGLKSGDKFAAALLQGSGIVWILCGAFVTLVPLVAVGLWARVKMKLNYLSISGLLAGSHTDPPALAFANQMAPSSNAQVISYAAIYPMVMILRVLMAQVLVLLLS